MRTNDYINAVLSILSEGGEFDDVIKKLKQTLEVKGHQKLYRSILLGLLKKSERAVYANVATVTTAREKDIGSLKEQIEKSLKSLNTTEFESRVDQSLVGGYVVEHDNKLIDNSYKSRLVALYRSLIR